jgi:hypothetical protein
MAMASGASASDALLTSSGRSEPAGIFGAVLTEVRKHGRLLKDLN